jgi:transitional endoplasmic reticulum ATPase
MDKDIMMWRLLSATVQAVPAKTALADTLVKWVRGNRKQFRLTQRKIPDWETIGVVAAQRAQAVISEMLDTVVGRIATVLRLDAIDAALLGFVVAADRNNILRILCTALVTHRFEPEVLFGSTIGATPTDIRARITKGDLHRLGLISLTMGKDGQMLLAPSWTLNRLLDRAVGDDEAIVELLVGRRQRATLSREAFARVGGEADLIIRLLSGAIAGREAGINILLYGPPGTGKTELARTVAEAAGAQLFSVGEADDDGEEPTRWDRVTAYRLAQRVAQRRAGTVLLFDEMEDMIGDAQPTSEGYFTRRDGSKIFINRLLETNAAPTLWTTNALGNTDPAILRRMSFVLKIDYPTPEATEIMLRRVAREEAVVIGDGGLARLATHAPETGTVLRAALRVGRIAGGGEGDATRVAQALVSSLRGGQPFHVPAKDPGKIDLALYEADQDMAVLIDRLASDATPDDFSLLLTGPPGTGKTGLAHHIAKRLDRPLIIKRASDLLSKWVGETEQQIAGAFDEALARGGVLLFDEVDSLLFDRSDAKQSWEVTQVNELLTWFDSHRLPFIAATNNGHKLDPAALRRFVFKLDLKPLSVVKAAAAYSRFFGTPAPAGLADLPGLTPGDLAVVARQMRYAGEASEGAAILTRLAAELAAKPGIKGRIGF